MNKFHQQILLNVFIVLFVHTGIFGQSDESKAPISVEQYVDPSRITIGDLVKYSIVVKRNPDVKVQMPSPGANLGLFEIRDYNTIDARKENGQIVEQTDYIISTFETGEFEIPSLIIPYTLAGDITVHELQTASEKIIVESLKPSEEGDIRDIKMPLEIPRNYRQLIFIIVVSVLVIAIGILAFFFFKRRREGKSLIPRRVKPPRPPHEVALEDLEELVASELLANGKVKKYYVTISEIIRRYIEGRFFLVAIEMTTIQLLNNMQQASIESEIIKMAEEFLESCDLVKFAKYIPTSEENENVTQIAFNLVNHTKLVIDEAAEEAIEKSEDGTDELASEDQQEDTATISDEVSEMT